MKVISICFSTSAAVLAPFVLFDIGTRAQSALGSNPFDYALLWAGFLCLWGLLIKQAAEDWGR